MMGSPIEDGSWNGVEAAYYAGAGSGEMIWLIVSIVCCIVAMIIGHTHESGAYKDAERKRRNKKLEASVFPNERNTLQERETLKDLVDS